MTEKRDLVREQVKGCEDEARRLRDELKARKSEEQIIVEFQKSDVYNQELTSFATEKIHCSWVVAEKLFKTGYEANWDTFVNAYTDSERALVRGEGELAHYVAPFNPWHPEA